MTLREISAEFTALKDMETDIDEQTFADTMESIHAAIEDKADAYAVIIADYKAEAEKYAAEIDRLQAHKTSVLRRIDLLKANLTDVMNQIGIKKLKTNFNSFTIQKNPPSVVIDDMEKIPFDFLVVQDPKVDKKALKTALQEGLDVNGCAHLETTEGVRIR